MVSTPKHTSNNKFLLVLVKQTRTFFKANVKKVLNQNNINYYQSHASNHTQIQKGVDDKVHVANTDNENVKNIPSSLEKFSLEGH